MFFDCCFAPKKKKKSHVAAKVIGVVAAVALTPLAFNFNPKKKEWGIASLLVSVTNGASKSDKNRRELTITFPGIGFIVKSWRRTARLCSIGCATRRAMRQDLHDFDDLDIDFDNVEDDVDIIISEQE
ncbi:MAG: hypothetical protein IJY27_00175 [Clostridia bacterium]|nr:hypothetical protein [Clostridia bacterium]